MSAAGVIMSTHGQDMRRYFSLTRLQLLFATILLLCLPSIGQGAGTVVVSFGSSSYTVSEAAGVVEIDLQISDAPDQQVGVFFTTDRPGNDFDSAIWEPGDADPKIISFPVFDDDIVDPAPLTFTVSVSDTTGGVAIGGSLSTTVIVLDDDPRPGSTLAILSGDGQDATISQLAPLVVEVRSPQNNPIQNAAVTWSVFPPGAAILESPGTLTGQDGSSSNLVQVLQTGIGPITVTAVGQGSGVVEFTIQTGFGDLPPPVVTLRKISGDFPGNAAVGSQHTLVLEALDPEEGAPLQEAVINWTVDPPDAAALADGETFTDGDGRSSNVLTVIERPGVITVTAGAPGLGTVQFTIGAFDLDTAPGLTDQERALGGVLKAACETLGGRTGEGEGDLSEGEQALLDVCNDLEGVGANEVKNALEQIMPKKSLAQGTLTLESQKRQNTNVKSRLSALRSGAKGFSFSGLNVNYAGQSIPGVAFAQLADAALGGGASADGEDPFGGRLGGFVNGSVSFGDRDSTTGETGFDFTTRGLTAGIDYRFTNELIAGATIGLARNNTDFDGNGGKTKANGYNLTVFGTWYQSQRLYVDGILSIGRNDYDMDRRISFGGVDTTANSSTDGTEFALSIGGGYEMNRGSLTFGPYGRLNLVKAKIDSYQEAPAGGLEMIVGSQTVDSLVMLVGGQVAHVVSIPQGILSPYARFELAHEFETDGRFVSARFVNDPNSGSFRFSTDKEDANYFNLGLGVSMLFARGRAGFLDYERMLGRNHMTQHTITAGIRLEF